jgi:hypothetical protein
MSQREVAEVLGVGQSTVNSDLQPDRNRSDNHESPVKTEEVSDQNRSDTAEPVKPEHDVAKELEQAEKQTRRIRALKFRLAIWGIHPAHEPSLSRSERHSFSPSLS